MGTTPAAPTEVPALEFRPDIEGLRAVAVALVVVLHAGVITVSGGYIGVDVFFVISGFLITSLLIGEVRATNRVSILGFYARRARRILPAACFVIAATVLAAYLQLGPLAGRSAALDGRWAAGFSANFRFIGLGTNYFASGLPPSPLQHYWSLAVEEQFYLVWPTLLFGLVLLGRRFGKPVLALQVGLVAIVVGSLYWSVHQTGLDATTAYFSPLTRAWELGAGALIALFTVAISTTPAALRAAATWIGLALIVFAAFALSATTEFPGYAALLPVGGAALVIAGGIGRPPGGALRVLGLSPLRWLGKISFSVYLWHWPVLVIAEERSPAPLSNVARVVCVLITLALSVGSYYAIERPLRATHARERNARSDWSRYRDALQVGVAAIAIAVAVSAYTNNRAVSIINGSGNGPGGSASGVHTSTTAPISPARRVALLEARVHTLVQQGLGLHQIPPDVDPPVLHIDEAFDQKYRRCTQTREEVAVKPCRFGALTSHKTIVVFGDSHAMEWMPALDVFAKREHYRIVAVYKASCPVPSVRVYALGASYPQCALWRTNALRYIRSLKPTAVVIAFTQAFTVTGGKMELDVWTAGLETSLGALGVSNDRIIEIGPNTFLPQDPGLCLSHPGADPAACTGNFWGRDIVDAELAVVRGAGATFIDTEPWFCIDHRCPVIIDKRIAYADQSHVSAQYALDLEPLLAARLEVAGLGAK